MPKRHRLATGIYADAYGISIVYYVNGQRAPEARFPPNTPLDRLIRWRKTRIGQEQELAPRDCRGSLARDVVQYLKRLKGQPCYKSEKSHLRAWLIRWPRIYRWSISREQIELAIADWRTAGYAARTIRHRCRALEALFHRLDGPRAATPVDDVILPTKPQPRPVSVADIDIAHVAQELVKHEVLKRLRTAKTRARFLVLATHAQRPAELQRARREDLDLSRRLWAVRGAKGSYNLMVPLNDEQAAAWTLFVAAHAWGAYDTRSFVRTLQRCGWPKGIRPYNLRHSTGFALSARGVDLGDIQALFAHTSPETTRRFYVPGQLERLTEATKKLEGRFGITAFMKPVPRSTSKVRR